MKKLINILWFSLLAVTLVACSNESKKQIIKEALQPTLLSNSAMEASCVYLTSDEKNNPVISWVEIDSSKNKFFYFANWEEANNKFSTPITIPITENTSIHEEGMPKIAIKGDGTIFAVYETSTPSPNSKWGISDILFIQSFDKGKRWTAPKSVSTIRTAETSCSFSGISRLSDGEIGIAWLDTNKDPEKKGRPVLFAKTLGKDKISTPVVIESEACQCCRVSITSSAKGQISIAFRDLLPGSIRDISMSFSSDNGKIFHRITDFSKDGWMVDGCPHNGPSIAMNNDKNYTAWFSGGSRKGVHYAELNAKGEVLQQRYLSHDGRFIQLNVLNDDTRVMAYNEEYMVGSEAFSRIMLTKINDTLFTKREITPNYIKASYPVLETYGDKGIVIAWTESGKIVYRNIDADKIIQKADEVKSTTISPVDEMKNQMNGQVEMAIDPVCGMKVNVANSEVTSLHKGKTIHFCSTHCKKMFDASSEKYLEK